MDTPIVDFLAWHREQGRLPFHMPGHKGRGDWESWDLTEIDGADNLYAPAGIIAQSEENARALFSSRRTLYGTEGSSQCVKAMLLLAMTCRRQEAEPVILSARNVHSSFVYGAGLLGLCVEWLWPEAPTSLCAASVTPQTLETVLSKRRRPPAAVYLTSPDYLGNLADIGALAAVAHRHGTLLLVDNAHGAYLHFLENPCHPLDFGADLCCDSAHKTLPALTGAAYLHIGANAPEGMEAQAKQAMAMFGSTSPSYLILASLDRCNAALAGAEPERIRRAAEQTAALRQTLSERGWTLTGTEPLKLTIHAAASGWEGLTLAERLRSGGIEPEYSDSEHVVLMVSGATTPEDLTRLCSALGENRAEPLPCRTLPLPKGRPVMSIREALLFAHETVPAEEAVGRICAAPTVSCPPAVPVAVSGEVIGPEALELFRHYGIQQVDVVCGK